MNSKKTLIKDLVILGIMIAIAAATLDTTPLAVIFLGVPFGWRWASKIITAVSLTGVVAKFLISAALGYIALPVVLIKDIIAVFVEAKENKM